MPNLDILLQMVLVLGTTITAMVLVIRLIGGDADQAGGLFQPSQAATWPRGVQEEDPLPWKFATAGR